MEKKEKRKNVRLAGSVVGAIERFRKDMDVFLVKHFLSCGWKKTGKGNT